MTQHMTDQPRVGYLVDTFATASDTALLCELRGVERAGVRIAVMALSHHRDRIQQDGTSDLVESLIRPCDTFPLGWLIDLASHLRVVWSTPSVYFRLLRDDLLRPLRRAISKPQATRGWRQLWARRRLFWLAPRIAYEARRKGAIHLHAHGVKEPLEMAARLRWLTGIPYSFAACGEELDASAGRRLSKRLTKAKFALTYRERDHRTLCKLAVADDRNKVSLALPSETEVGCPTIAALFDQRLKKARRAAGAKFRAPAINTGKQIDRARQLLGRLPRLQPDVERAIARSVLSGLRANSWRPDVQIMAERRLWDELAKARRAKELRRYARRLGVKLDEASRVLDLGCGRGGLSVALRAHGISTMSLDLRPSNCRLTQLRGQRYDLAIPAVTGRAEALPFVDNTFHVVCLLEVLEHVADPGKLLAEAHRVCRPRGVCVVTVVNRWAHLDPHYRLWGINFLPRRLAEAIIAFQGRSKNSWQDNQRLVDMHYFSLGAFRRFAGQVGFEVYDPSLPDRLIPALVHFLSRKLSLGFNTVTLVLEPKRR